MTKPNPQKLMDTRGGVVPKPGIRKRKGGSGSFPWPVEERRPFRRTRWARSIRELFGR